PFAAGEDAGRRRVDVDLQPVDRALGLDLGDAGVREPLLQTGAQRQILVQQLRVIAVRVPPRAPRLVEAETESKRVNFLTHSYSFAFVSDFRLLTSDFAASDFAAFAVFRCGRLGRLSSEAPTATIFPGR